MSDLFECTKCKELKLPEEFSPRQWRSKKVNSWCKKCHSEYQKARLANNPDIAFKRRLRNYGLTQAEYEAMLIVQNNTCAICGQENPGGRWGSSFAIDHDHSCCPGGNSCGKCVRGLLCSRCNAGLANFNDNPQVLQVAADYLMRSACVPREAH